MSERKGKFYERLKAFISEFSGCEEDEILESTGLQKDLGIYGDDSTELLVKYSKEFNVDVSNFMAADYFSGEGEIIFLPVLRRLFKVKHTKKNLTVGHLLKGIIFGRLDEDVINN